MASFDIVSKVDGQTLENAINNLKKEILNRFDFQGTNTTIELDKKSNVLTVVTESDMKIQQVEDVLISKLLKQGIDPGCLDASKKHYASGDKIRKEINIKSGIDKETGKELIKLIKDSKIKVQAQIQDEQVRVTGKKIDDLQEVIALVRASGLKLPFQFVNMKA